MRTALCDKSKESFKIGATFLIQFVETLIGMDMYHYYGYTFSDVKNSCKSFNLSNLEKFNSVHNVT